MNKKAASLSGLTEMILGLVLFMGALIIIVTQMNTQYSQSNDPTFGIASESTLNEFAGFQGSVQTGLEGEATTDQIEGVSLKSSWGMIKASGNLVFNFITGQWIYNGIKLMNLGEVGVKLATVLRILFVLAVAFIIMTILFKIKP
jgi:hypothetical protein